MTTQPQRYPQRVRNELHFRQLSVLRIERVSHGFQRIILGGEALQGFSSRGFDDHTKVFFSQDGSQVPTPSMSEEGILWPEGVRPLSRDYTPLYDQANNELALDFFIHQNGIASAWSMQAQIGDKLLIGGPRGSFVVPEDYGYQVYVCDESGMPALRRRLEALSRLTVQPHVTALVSVQHPADRAYLAHLSAVNIEWLAPNTQAIAERLAQLQVPAEDYFIWITGEGKVVKQLSAPFEQAPFDQRLVRSAAYWHQK